MKSLHASALFLFLLFVACQKSVDPVVTRIVNTPDPVTAPVSNTPTLVSSTVSLPALADLYRQFAAPIPASATQRLKEINVYKDSSLVAKSTCQYNPVGLLASRIFIEGQPGGIVSRVISYTYGTDSQLLREAVSNLATSGSEAPTSLTEYAYTNGLLASVSRQSRVSFYPLNLNNHTTYQYTGKALTSATSLSYYNALCSCNTAYPTDSTRQVFSADTKQTTRVDSVWLVCPPSAACSSQFSRQVATKTERDARGNIVLMQTSANSQPQASYTYSHQYTGPDGLISSSVNQTLGLRYVFVYEGK
ncbi:hypothetical protein [Fibrella arboris]|uniref:hypothetical protein n=1 Tax=Fibrella arboris TaxID=3242486 RepID=UPI00352117CA